MRIIHPQTATVEINHLLQQARETVYIKSNVHIPFVYRHPEPSLTHIIGSIPLVKDIRIILGIMEDEDEFHAPLLEKVSSDISIINQARFGNVRVTYEWSGFHLIIVDRLNVLAARSGFGFDGKVMLLEGSESTEYLANFERHWSHSWPFNMHDFGINKAIDAEVLVISENSWSDIVKNLAKNPNDLFSMPPRKFEELVAHILEQQGMQTQLTPRTRDGGRDVLAWFTTPVGRFLYLVECKRYAPERLVGVGLVRQLYGVVEEERASGGIFVTTSRFTKDAWGFEGRCGSRMKLADYRTLVDWLDRLRIA